MRKSIFRISIMMCFNFVTMIAAFKTQLLFVRNSNSMFRSNRFSKTATRRLFLTDAKKYCPAGDWKMPPVPSSQKEIPLLFLDVDGVIAPSYSKDRVQFSRVKVFFNPQVSVKVDYRKEVVDQVNTWSRNRLAEVRWMTYWGPNAPLRLAPLLQFDAFENGRDVVADTTKQVQILLWANRNPQRKMVWLDDAISKYIGWRDNESFLTNPNLLLVQPKQENFGATNEDLELINKFLNNLLTEEEILKINKSIFKRK